MKIPERVRAWFVERPAEPLAVANSAPPEEKVEQAVDERRQAVEREALRTRAQNLGEFHEASLQLRGVLALEKLAADVAAILSLLASKEP